jgi:hypothetical protein
MISWILGVVIFSFAGWTLYKNIKKSKQGKCPSCSSHSSHGKENCQCH